MNLLTAIPAVIFMSDYQQSSFFLQQREEGSVVLHTRHENACSIALRG